MLLISGKIYLPQIKQEQSTTKDLFTETSVYLSTIYLAKLNTKKIIHSQLSHAVMLGVSHMLRSQNFPKN